VEWRGEIPRHWDVKRLKYMATVRNSNVDKKSVDTEDEVSLLNYTDVYYNEYITADIDFMQATATAQQIQLFELKEDDVVVTKDSESWDDIAVPTCVDQDLRGVVCAYHLTLIRPVTDRTCGRYLARYFASTPGAYQFKVGANGVTRFGLSQKVLRDSLFLVPPLHEQRAIASYLDAETARIDKLITKTERLNELLREKRTALISQAVTKGLDAGVAMKESGVEWLGEIPRHWDVKRLKFLTRKPLMYGANEAADDNRRDYPRYIRITDIKEDGSLRDDTFRSLPYEIATPYLLTEGDILFARSGATVGKTFRYQADWGIACFAGYLIRFRCDPTQVISECVDYYTSSKPYWEWVNGIFIKATIQNISAEKYANTSLGVPPLHEQRAIAAYLDAETARIDKLIDKNDRLIHLLREKRSALISAAVTGKIAVPSVSAVVK
ncbi:MAG: restriction endonuclease subunit S, partial [Chloroflexi bacterium]|nr:restriction endonuclease subunit S [Chloroflexota bacterium]